MDGNVSQSDDYELSNRNAYERKFRTKLRLPPSLKTFVRIPFPSPFLASHSELS